MARIFSINTSDSIQAGLSSTTAQRTRACWFRLNEANGAIANYGRLWTKGQSGVSADEVFRYLDDVATLQFRFNWTTTGIWNIAAPALNQWHHLLVTYDYGSSSNNPVIYIDGVSVTVTVNTAPSGSITTTAFGYWIGNNCVSPTNSGAGSDMAEFAVWDRILASDEITGLGNGQPASNYPSSLGLYVPMTGSDIADIMGGGTTLTGTTVTDDPPIWRPLPNARAQSNLLRM